MKRRTLTIMQTMRDPNLFGAWFGGPSWNAWRTVLKAAFALTMSNDEREFFRTVASRDPPSKQVRELWVVAGRRAGKDSIASVIAAHVAALFDQQAKLRPGERALVACLACDREQSKIVLNYTRAYFQTVPMLQRMIRRETGDGLELDNLVDVVVATNNYRAPRGRTFLCAIFDELAFWYDERSARPDKETYRAIVPGLATLPGMLIGISTPHGKSGLLYEKFSKHYGKDGDDVLVIRAPSIALNPTLDQGVIDQALADDPEAAKAEWLGEFRGDVSNFLDVELIESAVDRGVAVRPPVPGVRYASFIDSSGGRHDSFCAAVAHDEHGVAFLDAVFEKRAPFDPIATTREVSSFLKSYHVTKTEGDRYSAGWVVEAFAKNSIKYQASDRDRSAIYLDTLPLFTSGRARLIDSRRLVSQFAQLERKTSSGGRDRVTHPEYMGADDLCNAAAGALTLATQKKAPLVVSDKVLAWSRQSARSSRTLVAPW